MSRRVVVVGGGLTGLATAWHLRTDHEVILLEASSRLGGEIRTVSFAGSPMDVGADAFLARRPEGLALLRDVGFTDDEIVVPAVRQVYLWIRGRLRPLPTATVLGVPTDVRALCRSGVLTPRGVVRAALEPWVPSRATAGDRSVADLVSERFGREVVDLLVEPLLSGVYAGRADRLSVQAAAPPIWAAARDHRRLTPALSEHRRHAAEDERPVFATLAAGLTRLVERLSRDLGPCIRLGAAATSLEPRQAGWRVSTPDGDLDADVVVLAVPSGTAATLLATSVSEASRELAAIRTASVAVIALAYRSVDARNIPDMSGFLVPRSERRLVKAVTFSSRKWPHHAARERFVLRASVGRVDEGRALDVTDEVLAGQVDAEVRAATGIGAPAVDRLVVRWPHALPQYDVGHLARVGRIRAAVQTAPAGLYLAGAALDGVGLTARAAEAADLARSIRRDLASPDRGDDV